MTYALVVHRSRYSDRDRDIYVEGDFSVWRGLSREELIQKAASYVAFDGSKESYDDIEVIAEYPTEDSYEYKLRDEYYALGHQLKQQRIDKEKAAAEVEKQRQIDAVKRNELAHAQRILKKYGLAE